MHLKKIILAFCELLNNPVYDFLYNFKWTCFQTHSKTSWAKVESQISTELELSSSLELYFVAVQVSQI